MSQTFFSKLTPEEKTIRLTQFGSLKGEIVVWKKGSQDKHKFSILNFDKAQMNIVLDTKDDVFSTGTFVLCSFEFRGMSFFSKAVYRKSISGLYVLEMNEDLFKSERRSSYRLLTYPIYEVWTEFDLTEVYEGDNVINFKSRTGQTELFKNFLKLVESEEDPAKTNRMKVRVQDVSTTGMSIYVGEVESKFFIKDSVFHNVNIKFLDENIEIPQVKVVYVVDYISREKAAAQYKVGLQFLNINTRIDHLLGGKINQLLREVDSNGEFENFVK